MLPILQGASNPGCDDLLGFTVLVGVFRTLSILVGALLVDRVGRRPLRVRVRVMVRVRVRVRDPNPNPNSNEHVGRRPLRVRVRLRLRVRVRIRDPNPNPNPNEHVGRRPLLLASTAGVAASLALLAAGLWRSTLWLTLLGLCGFMGACAPRSPPHTMHCAMPTP